jgi:hypothetical protein
LLVSQVAGRPRIVLWDPAASSVSSDGDPVPDALDNCVGVANADQYDTDGDGYGNRCDADLDNNGLVNFVDLGRFRAAFGTTHPHADLDANGFVNIADLAIFRSLLGRAPGPSALLPHQD